MADYESDMVTDVLDSVALALTTAGVDAMVVRVAVDREANVDAVGDMRFVLDLGVRQSGLACPAPEDRLQAAVDETLLRQFPKDLDDARLHIAAHSQVGVVPIAAHPQPLELCLLLLDEGLRIGAAALPHRHLVRLLRGRRVGNRRRVVAIEEVFFSANAKSALKLGQVRGVAMLAAASSGLPVAEYAPLKIKSSVVGYGLAAKEQVQFMVTRLLELDQAPESADAADALAIAICHIHTAQTLSLQGAGR